MTWWQWLIGALGTLWAFGALAQASREAEKAARDAAFARYELDNLKTWLTHNLDLLHERQLAMVEQLDRLPCRPRVTPLDQVDED